MKNRSIICLFLLNESTQAIKNKDVLNPDVLDEIAETKNEFTHMAIKEHKEEQPIENVAVSQEIDQKDSGDQINDELDESASYQSLLEKKKDLTSEIRSAGITNQDQDFMDSFSEAMTS